ncbi:hypothetical protein [Shouchella shacheensis]|uniref:hypothetical protein n=1 Tax=Shouchella shacheensis TaxID=1649580 RepID=UPI00073FBE95|nr:hypothetical protein [Shouchella shacheensis]
MKTMAKLVSVLSVSVLLAGCFLPEEQRAENQVPYPDQIASVQNAVERFQADTAVLPIRTFDETTPTYQRYVIDFNQLVPEYMADPPGTAFENGGTFQYVLVNVEEAPEVKLVDLSSMNVIQDLQRRLDSYMREHTYAPVDEPVDSGLVTLDFSELGYSEEPFVESPYDSTFLPLLLTNEGDVVIDYKIDLNKAIQERDSLPEEGEDLRPLLYEESPFVPIHSVPYSLDESGEPTYHRGLNDI